MSFGRYTCGVQWHIVLDGIPELPGEGGILVEPQANHQSYAATWRIQARSWVDSGFDFCRITLVHVLLGQEIVSLRCVHVCVCVFAGHSLQEEQQAIE